MGSKEEFEKKRSMDVSVLSAELETDTFMNIHSVAETVLKSVYFRYKTIFAIWG